jgi:hypothetical protein
MTSVDERWVVEPFRMDDAEEFERLREVFGALEYTEPDVCSSRVDQFAALDMESRWEYCLRMRLLSGWQRTPLVLERYPQRF